MVIVQRHRRRRCADRRRLKVIVRHRRRHCGPSSNDVWGGWNEGDATGLLYGLAMGLAAGGRDGHPQTDEANRQRQMASMRQEAARADIYFQAVWVAADHVASTWLRRTRRSGREIRWG